MVEILFNNRTRYIIFKYKIPDYKHNKKMKQNLTHITTSNQVEDAHESKTFTTLSDELAQDNAPKQRSPAI